MSIQLHEFARRNLLSQMREAIAQGADLNARSAYRATPLHCAIAEKNGEMAALLLEHGADVTAQDKDGSTALHYAVEHNLIQVAECLLKTDANLVGIADRHGNEPLWTAVFKAKGNYDFVTLLLRYGADSKHLNQVGLSPVDIAKRQGDDLLLKILESP